MPVHAFEYVIVRVVPRVERQEFANVGVVLSCPACHFLQAQIEPDWERLAAFAGSPLDKPLIAEYLKSIPRVCDGGREAGAIGLLPQRARFHWLAAPRSTMIQTSPMHSGLCENPSVMLENLMARMVRF